MRKFLAGFYLIVGLVAWFRFALGCFEPAWSGVSHSRQAPISIELLKKRGLGSAFIGNGDTMPFIRRPVHTKASEVVVPKPVSNFWSPFVGDWAAAGAEPPSFFFADPTHLLRAPPVFF